MEPKLHDRDTLDSAKNKQVRPKEKRIAKPNTISIAMSTKAKYLAQELWHPSSWLNLISQWKLDQS